MLVEHKLSDYPFQSFVDSLYIYIIYTFLRAYIYVLLY